MRGVGAVARVIGWLLTPLVAWAASLYGAWVALRAQATFASPRTAIYVAFGVAVVSGTLVLFLWMQVLRRSPRLRKSLHINREGLPVVDDMPEPGGPSETGPAAS